MVKKIALSVITVFFFLSGLAGAKELDKRSGIMLHVSMQEYCGFDLVDKSKNDKGIDVLIYCKKVAGTESMVMAALNGTCLTHVSILANHDFPDKILLASIQLAFFNLALAKRGDAFISELKKPDNQNKINDSVIKLWKKIDKNWKKVGKNSFGYDYGIKVDTSVDKKMKYVTLSLPDR